MFKIILCEDDKELRSIYYNYFSYELHYQVELFHSGINLKGTKVIVGPHFDPKLFSLDEMNNDGTEFYSIIKR